MSLAQILQEEGSFKKRKRVGRGIGSTKGKTCGRGVKGQKSRTGVAIKGFEGGQMPIHRRLPKRGFNNIFRTKYNVINLSKIQELVDNKKLDATKEINDESFVKAGFIKNDNYPVKVLGNGEIKAKVNIKVIKFTKSAEAKITKAGGKISN